MAKSHNGVKTLIKTNGGPVLDYPRQGEKIEAREYAVRVGAPADAKAVEVAVDQGAWKPCRYSVGYWWFDWSGFDPGEHELIARVQTEDGRMLRSEIHDCFAAAPGKAKTLQNT